MAFTSSLSSTGILIMVNSLFFCNYFFIRSLRATTDRFTTEASESLLSRLRQQLRQNRVVDGLFNFQRTVVADRPQKQGQGANWIDSVYGFVFGQHRLENNDVTQFPNWDPIPSNLGIISTSFVLLLSIFLLSPDLFKKDLSVTSSQQGNTGLCRTDDHKTKMDLFDDYIRTNVTNFQIGQQQHNRTVAFHEAFLKDTTLYGEHGHGCPLIPKNKVEYKNMNLHLQQGPFFPGHCAEALRIALEQAKAIPCEKTMRVCVDGWGLSVLCKTIKVPTPCAAHTYDAEVEELENYRLEQYKLAEQGEIEIDAEDLSDLGSRGPSEMVTSTIEKLLRQFDLAGTFYSIYVCVALFFPSPLQIYRTSLGVRSKQLVFGIHKYTFMATIVAIWWGYEYLTLAVSLPEFDIYLNNIMTDPCFLDAKFLQGRYQIVENYCSQLISMESEWEYAMDGINRVTEEVELFENSCDCPRPERHVLGEFGHEAAARLPGFEYHMNYWRPMKDFEFVANTTICLDSNYARQEILVAEDSGLSFWEIWFQSALLANLVVKFAVSNFGAALLRLADPFSTCAGTYESPPNVLLSVNEAVKDQKAAALQAAAFRECLIWFLITNSSLLSLLVLAYDNYEEYLYVDKVVFGISMSLTTLIPIGYYLITRRAKRYVNDILRETA